MAKTVLIVEDNELNMKLFRDLLEAHGYQTSGTSNGFEALDLVRKLRPDLIGQIDGCIICQNALDHCEDPLAILSNLGQYAKAGCYLLFWSDIWHIAPPDEGHRNITRSQDVMDSLFSGLGFEIVRRGLPIRSDNSTIEYGIVARKIR